MLKETNNSNIDKEDINKKFILSNSINLNINNSENNENNIFDNTNTYDKHRISVAPMIDFTTPYYRYFMRLITTQSVLYTDMINANTIL